MSEKTTQPHDAPSYSLESPVSPFNRYGTHSEKGLLVVPDGEDAPILVTDHEHYNANSENFPESTDSQRAGSLYPVPPAPKGPIEIGTGEKKESIKEEEPYPHASRTMSRRSVLIIVIAVSIVVAAIVGGAIGGALSSSKKSKPAATAPASSVSTTQAAPSATSSSAELEPFMLQIWENLGYQGRSQMYSFPGGYSFAFTARSYHWEPGPYSGKLRCSLAICFNNQNNGWWGMSQRMWPGNPQNVSIGAYAAHISCKDVYEDPICPNVAELATYTTVPVIETTPIPPSKILPTPTDSSTTSESEITSTQSLPPSSVNTRSPASTSPPPTKKRRLDGFSTSYLVP